MTTWVTRCMIVPSASVALVKSTVEALSGWSGMFTVGLNASGSDSDPITHYISHGQISTEFASLLESASALEAAASAAGLNMAVSDAEALLNSCIISSDDAHVVLAANGLKLARPADPLIN